MPSISGRRSRMTTLKAVANTLMFLSVVPLAARAAGEPALERQTAGDLALAPAAPAPDLMRRGYDDGPYSGRRSRQDARQGLLLSFGLGGGSLYLSDKGPGRIGAADID